jgi:hypothetical protein
VKGLPVIWYIGWFPDAVSGQLQKERSTVHNFANNPDDSVFEIPAAIGTVVIAPAVPPPQFAAEATRRVTSCAGLQTL